MTEEETCDDENQIVGDGCDPYCSLEPGWRCEGNPSLCTEDASAASASAASASSCDTSSASSCEIIDGASSSTDSSVTTSAATDSSQDASALEGSASSLDASSSEDFILKMFLGNEIEFTSSASDDISGVSSAAVSFLNACDVCATCGGEPTVAMSTCTRQQCEGLGSCVYRGPGKFYPCIPDPALCPAATPTDAQATGDLYCCAGVASCVRAEAPFLENCDARFGVFEASPGVPWGETCPSFICAQDWPDADSAALDAESNQNIRSVLELFPDGNVPPPDQWPPFPN